MKRTDSRKALAGKSPAELQTELEALLKKPEPQTTLVLLASDVDRTRKVYKTLQKQSTIVECWGLRVARDGRIDLREVARRRRRKAGRRPGPTLGIVDAQVVKCLGVRGPRGHDAATAASTASATSCRITAMRRRSACTRRASVKYSREYSMPAPAWVG